MTNTLEYILKKIKIIYDEGSLMPIEIPNVGRNNIPEWLNELNFKTGVEIGVGAGEYGVILAKTNPQMQFYGIDPWIPYEGGIEYVDAATLKKLYRKFKEVIAPYPNYKEIRKLSMDAVRDFPNESLDFVYIDANHSEPYITQDITGWYKKLRVGGILSGHDYIQPARRGRKDFVCNVIDATQRFIKEKNIRPWFILGLKAKGNGMVRDATRSWMWVKS